MPVPCFGIARVGSIFALLVVDGVRLGLPPSLRSLARMGLKALVLGFAQLDLSLSPRTWAQVDLVASVTGLARTGPVSLLFVAALVNFGIPPSLRSSSHVDSCVPALNHARIGSCLLLHSPGQVGSFTLAISASRLGSLLLLLEYAACGPTLLMQSLSRAGFSPVLLEFSKPGSFTSLRGYSWTSSSSSSVGIARLGSCFSPSAVAAATPGPFPPLQSLAHTGFATSVLEFAKLDSLVLPQQPGCVGLTYSLHGLERIGSVSLLSVANLGCLDLPVLVRSVCRLGLAVPALGFSHLEPLVLSRRFGCLGLTLLTSGASTMGFRLIASDRTCLGSSVPMRSYARAEPAALASNLSEPDTVLPLRGLSCLEALTPPSGLS